MDYRQLCAQLEGIAEAEGHYVPLLANRVVQSAILTAAQLAVIELIARALPRFRKKVSL